jgi:hypothetical protein
MTEIDREVVARRIRALLNKTVANGCSEAEAIAAAEKARELMDQYRLSQSDLDIEQEEIIEKSWKRHHAVKVSPSDKCLSGIQRYCGIRMWFQKEGKRRMAVGFGLRSDVEMAEWLYDMIGTAILGQNNHYWDTVIAKDEWMSSQEKRQALWDFEVGMAQRINSRLNEMAQALEPVAKTGSGTALIVVKGAVVNAAYDKRHALTRWGKAPSGGSYRHSSAYGHGAAAGDRVNLNRPVGATVRARLH